MCHSNQPQLPLPESRGERDRNAIEAFRRLIESMSTPDPAAFRSAHRALHKSGITVIFTARWQGGKDADT